MYVKLPLGRMVNRTFELTYFAYQKFLNEQGPLDGREAVRSSLAVSLSAQQLGSGPGSLSVSL